MKNDPPKLVDPLPPTEERARLFSRDSSPWSEFTGPLHSPADLRVSLEVLGFVRAMPAAFHSSNVPPKPKARRKKRLMCRPFDRRGHCGIAAFFAVPATPEGLAYAAHAAAAARAKGRAAGLAFCSRAGQRIEVFRAWVRQQRKKAPRTAKRTGCQSKESGKPADHSGRITASITWITPLLVAMSVLVTLDMPLAVPPITPSSVEIFTVQPPELAGHAGCSSTTSS